MFLYGTQKRVLDAHRSDFMFFSMAVAVNNIKVLFSYNDHRYVTRVYLLFKIRYNRAQ